MMKWGCRVVAVAWLTAIVSTSAAIGAEDGTNVEVEKPAATVPPETETGYRPPWADPNAKPMQPGVENDPTPFNPADVDANSDTLGNTANDVDQ
ncbi:MAG: hypothetical protein WDN31_13300 [Hyphomicrobium sp.]